MAVALNHTAADPEANSYVSINEMDQFVEERPGGADKTAWKALSLNNQERWLIQAALLIDRAHYYIGRKITDLTGAAAQSLEFPRASLDYAGGRNNLELYREGSDAWQVDPRVKRATMAQALFMVYQSAAAGAPLPMGGTVRAQLQAEGVTDISIGNTSESYNGKAAGLCPEAEGYLRPLIRRARSI